MDVRMSRIESRGNGNYLFKAYVLLAQVKEFSRFLGGIEDIAAFLTLVMSSEYDLSEPVW